MRSLILPALLVATSCVGSKLVSTSANPGAITRASVAVKLSLPKGTLIELEPCEVVRPGPAPREQIDGLMREALRQSECLDFAEGVEDCNSPWQLIVAVDPQAMVLTASLLAVGKAPVPLCTAAYFEAAIPAAIDELSSGSLQALDADPGASFQACAILYSASRDCVRLTEQGMVKLNRGDAAGALRLLRHASTADPGCTVTRIALGTALLVSGQNDAAVKLARGALQHMALRMSPTTTHRMARLTLLAEVAANSGLAARNDNRLLQLAEAFLRDRPHDPHGLYSRALALNYLRRFEEAAPILRALRVRWPRVAPVAYHLSFAELATGHPAAALDAIESAAHVLTGDQIVLPKSLALYHSGHLAELERYLQRLAARTARSDDRRQHEILRIQASLAILTGKRERAAEFLLTDMEWLRRRPSLLQSLALDVAENGEVLLRLGYHKELAARILAFEELRLNAPRLRQTQAYLSALVSIQELGELPASAIRSLESENQFVWSSLLKATLHHHRGELPEEARYLATAVRITDGALTRASFARALEALGRHDEAQILRRDLRTKLLTFDLRSPMNHPLLNPARALAFLSVNP